MVHWVGGLTYLSSFCYLFIYDFSFCHSNIDNMLPATAVRSLFWSLEQGHWYRSRHEVMNEVYGKPSEDARSNYQVHVAKVHIAGHVFAIKLGQLSNTVHNRNRPRGSPSRNGVSTLISGFAFFVAILLFSNPHSPLGITESPFLIC